MSNLQVVARRCPVMSKALAVQGARNGQRGFASRAAGAPSAKLFRPPVGNRALHTTDKHPASLNEATYRNSEQGKNNTPMLCSMSAN